MTRSTLLLTGDQQLISLFSSILIQTLLFSFSSDNKYFAQAATGPGLYRVLSSAKRARQRHPKEWQRGRVFHHHQPLPLRTSAHSSRFFQPGPSPPSTPPARPTPPTTPAFDHDIAAHNQFLILLENAKLSQAMMYAEGTKRNNRSNIKQFILFCVKFKRPVCPTDRETLMAFARLEAATMAYGSIKNIFSSIKFLHRALNEPFPEDDWQVESTLKAIKRELSGAAHQTLPITPDILMKMYLFIDIAKPKGLANWACFLTSFYCLLRKSSAVPTSLAKFDPVKGLSRLKVSFPTSRNICMVLLTHSKTDQFGNRNMIVPMVTNPIQALCPVFHMKALFTRFSLNENHPAFSYQDNNTVKCITYDGFTKELRRLLNAAGYKANSYSGHSFRRGAATYLYSLGADPLLIQASGDWKTDCFHRYVFLSLDQRLQAQEKMAHKTLF